MDNSIQKLYLTSPIPPSVNHYLGYRAVMMKGKPMVMPYKKSEAVKYQKEFAEYVKEQVKTQSWIMSDNKSQHYYMDCVFYFARTDKDANNYFKCMADAITDTGCVWIDDTQLCERVQGIFYDVENPRVEITIYPVEYCGIFSTVSYLNLFKNKCQTCKRYKRNCSILKKAQEGKIQSEIAFCDGLYSCEKYSGMK